MAISSSKNLAQPKSNLVLYVVLAITLALTGWMAFDGSDEPDASSAVEVRHQDRVRPLVTQPISQHEQARNQTSDAHSLPLFYSLDNSQSDRLASTKKIQDLFKPHTWYVPPPVKKVVQLAPPPPVAPPAPFNYMGKLENSPKGTLIFLMANNTLYSVIKGEKINPQWRLDSEDINTIKLTYLPLQLPQVLIKSAKNSAVSNVANTQVNSAAQLENAAQIDNATTENNL